MDDARKCYQQYIESEAYEKNNGWRQKFDNLSLVLVPFVSEREWDDFDTALSGALCEFESRSFAAGFNAALRLWAGRLMESNQWSLT